MQALLLRLRTQLWLDSGHGFNTLSDALLGMGGEIPSKAERESVELRVTRAACLRDVCAQDVGKGLQLLEGIKVSRQDSRKCASPQVILQMETSQCTSLFKRECLA